MRKLKKIILAILLASFCYAFWWCAMNYAGYCHAEGRFLSDQEKIYSAVKYVMPHSYPRTIKRQRNISINGVIGKSDYLYENKKPIKYKDEQDFLALNPDCCTLSMKIGEIGEIERPPLLIELLVTFPLTSLYGSRLDFLMKITKSHLAKALALYQ